jgi:hypothetical protein
MKKIGRQGIDPLVVAEEAQQLSAIWHRTPVTSRGGQAEFGEKFKVGSQSAVGQFLRGEIPINMKAARGFAAGLQCNIGDFSPRLAAEIEALAQGTGIARPAMVVAAGPPSQWAERPTRPGLLRGVGNAFDDALKGYGKLKSRQPIYDGVKADLTLTNAQGQCMLAIECKSYDLAERTAPNLATLTGKLWMMRHGLFGQDATNLPIFLVFLLENASTIQDANETEQELHRTAVLLQENALLNGFTIMRVHDKDDGQTELHDLPKTPQTLQHLIENVKQTATNLKQ